MTPPAAFAAPLLEMRGIKKRFGATVALDGVDLSVAAGEVLALVGENGAGKSTLMKVLSGAHAPDEGSMTLLGEAYAPRNPLEARRRGVAMIYQELSLAPHLTAAENILLGVEPHRGIALDRFHPTMVGMQRMATLLRDWRIEDGAPIILLPGRITRWKGHHVLLEAMARLQRPDVFCVLLGSDQGRTEYRAELEAQIEKLNLTGQVRIIDHCNDMPAAYMISSVVVSASTDPEGFGRVPVEAQAMGRPIIATDHGGAQETIMRGETGWLVPPGDAAALAKAMAEALSLDAAQRAVLATRAMAHVAAHFTRNRMADETLNVYAELLAEKFASGAGFSRAGAGPLNLGRAAE